MAGPQKLRLLATGLVCLVLGYFAGREHLKYEVRQAFSGATKSLSDGLAGAFGGTGGARESPESGSESDADELPPVAPIALGDALRGELVVLTVESASVGRISVRDIMGERKESTSDALKIVLHVWNMHDRKVVRFSGANRFLSSGFSLEDDVANSIRRVNYGLGSEVVGALGGSEDILPEESATHVLVFQVPPPKTEFLLLSADLSAFGDEGDGVFKIPVSAIEGFASPRR